MTPQTRDVRRRELGGQDPIDRRLGAPPPSPLTWLLSLLADAIRSRLRAVPHACRHLSAARRASRTAGARHHSAGTAPRIGSRRVARPRRAGCARRHGPRARDPIRHAPVHRGESREPRHDSRPWRPRPCTSSTSRRCRWTRPWRRSPSRLACAPRPRRRRRPIPTPSPSPRSRRASPISTTCCRLSSGWARFCCCRSRTSTTRGRTPPRLC